MLFHRILFTTPVNPGPRFVGGYAEGLQGSTSPQTVTLSSLTGGLASAPAEGDIVVIAVGISTTTNINVSISTSGYTELVDLYANDTEDANLGVYWKIMGSTPDSSVDIGSTNNNNNGAGVAIHVWRGVDQSTPIDVTTTTSTITDSVLADPPAITPVTTGAIILACGGGAHNGAGSAVYTHSLDNLQTATGADVQDGLAGIVSYSGWISGAYNPDAFGFTASDSTSYSACAATVVLRPTS